ncbi:MAG: hypothetical protein QM703_04795 [Gemmatales bacterium]
MKKYFKLLPLLGQLIIFLSFVALLWQSKPIPGPDGLVEARIEFISNWGGWSPSKHITIQAEKWHPVTNELITRLRVEDALMVSCTTVPRIGLLMKSLDYAPWLVKVLPQRFTNRDDVYDVVVRITPAQWEQLEAAKHAGYKLSCTGGSFTFTY